MPDAHGAAAPLNFKTSDALFAAPQRALSLPRFHGEVPLRLARGDGSTDTLANLAQALLDEKVLRSSDWRGDLGQTIEFGLNRWINVEMKAQNLKRYIVSFEYSDNIEGVDNFDVVWRRDANGYVTAPRGHSTPGSPERPLGIFALDHNSYDPLPCIKAGRKVLELERVQKNLGFHLLALVDRAAQAIAESITPRWARYYCEEQWELNGGADAAREAKKTGEDIDEYSFGMLSPKEFDSMIPKAAHSANFSRRAVRESLSKALDFAKYSSDQGTALCEALRLIRIMDNAARLEKRPDWEANFFASLEFESVMPMAIYWQDDDPITRVGDDYLEMLSQSEATSIVWFTAFLADDVKSIKIAVARLKIVLEAMVCLDGILNWLHTDSRLVNILGNEPAQVAARENRNDLEERQRVRLAA